MTRCMSVSRAAAVAAAVLSAALLAQVGRVEAAAPPPPNVDPCHVTFDSAGVGFDLTALQNTTGPYKYTMPPYVYEYQFCDNLPTCGVGGVCAAAQYDQNGVFLYDLGQLNAITWKLLDESNPSAGVMLIYGGGTECYLPQPVAATTTLKISCLETATTPQQLTVEAAQCQLTVSFKSAYGCPSTYTNGLSVGWVLVTLIFAATVLYLIGGVTYKQITLGTSGIESIPNIDFWRDFFGYVADGCRFSWSIITCHKRHALDRQLLATDEPEHL